MNHAEVIALNKSANILEMSTITSAGGGKKKPCCNMLKWDWRCQMGRFKNIPKLPLKVDVGVE